MINRKFLAFLIFWLFSLMLVLTASRGSHFFPFSYESEVGDRQKPQIFWHLANFDGAHYQNIAQKGYIAKFQTNFFPFYPLFINRLGTLLGGNTLVAAVLISGLSLFGSVILLKKITSSWSPVYILLFFPTSFFLIAGYTESLFIFLSLLVWYLYKKDKFLLSALVGIFLSATRYYGVLMLPIIFIDYFFRAKRSYRRLWPYILLPLGLIVYMFFLKENFNNPLEFLAAQAMWNKQNITFPLQTLFRYLKIFASVSPNQTIFWVALLEFVSFFFGLLAAWIFFRARQYAFAFYQFVGIIIPAMTGTLQSLPRYLLDIFPLFFLASFVKINKKIVFCLCAGSFILQLILFKLFATGTFIS